MDVAADRASQSQLARWCATVGAVLFEPHAAADTSAAIDQIAIVSWNVHEGHGDIDRLIGDLRGRFSAGVPVTHFVLLLQEVTRRDSSVPARIAPGDPVPHAILAPARADGGGVPRFAAQGLAVLYAPSMRNGSGAGDRSEDRGNAIVSTLPLAGAQVIELPLERQRRVAVAAAVQGLNQRLTGRGIFASSTCTSTPRSHCSTTARSWRAGVRPPPCLAAVDGASGGDIETASIVLGGDLNTWMGDREPAVRLLRAAFPGTPAAERVPTWGGPLGLHATLDHLFVRGGITASPIVRLPNRFGSDHFPLLTMIRF